MDQHGNQKYFDQYKENKDHHIFPLKKQTSIHGWKNVMTESNFHKLESNKRKINIFLAQSVKEK